MKFIIKDMTDETLNYLGNRPEVSLIATILSFIINYTSIMTWIKELTVIGAFIIMVLTVVSLVQKIKLNHRKLTEDGNNN